jgi:hypothetical protein
VLRGKQAQDIRYNMAVAITEESHGDAVPLDLSWHRSAPRRVIKKYQENDAAGGWTVWQRHLARRKKPQVPQFLSGREPPLLWGWPKECKADWVQIALKSPILLARRVLEDDGVHVPSNSEALQWLAAAYALPSLAQETSPEMWWRLATRLRGLAIEAQQRPVAWPADPHDVVRHQLLTGELPLALGYLFPEVEPLRALRNAARTFLSDGLLELTDGEGLPHARLLPVLGQLFGCWTRCRWLGRKLARGAWSDQAETQYQWLVRHAIRLADKGGRFILTGTHQQTRWSRGLFSMALQLAGDKRDYAAAKVALGGRVVGKPGKSSGKRLPKPSLDSEWSGITVMADGWSDTANRLAVAYSDDPIELELAVNGEQLLAGPWTFETTCDGKPVHAVGDWENLFWSSDKLCDMLELGIRLSEGLRLERQLVFGRKDNILYIADVVISADGRPRPITHSCRLPLAGDIRWRPEAETRDGLLLGGKVRAAVLPLALPEWRSNPRGGSLVENGGGLVLTQETTCRALYCPVFMDLRPERASKERTWRQLTVAEWMEVVPRDVAAGFRVQSGSDQWLFYRSLGAAGNRTVLGQNIAGEFCAGRFRSTGKFDDWIEIEAA